MGGLTWAVREATAAPVPRVTILGAGATARAALIAVAQLGAQQVSVLARTPSRAEALRALSDQLGVELDIRPWSVHLPDADLVVSTVISGAADSIAQAVADQRPADRRRDLRSVADRAGDGRSASGLHGGQRTGPPGRSSTAADRTDDRPFRRCRCPLRRPPHRIISVSRPYPPVMTEVPETTKGVVRRLITEVLNAGNLDVIDELYAAALAPAARRWIGAFHTSFTDVRMEIVELVAEDQKVVGRFTCSGTQQGEWRGHSPTGRRFERVDEVAIFDIRNGKIIKAWSLEDTLSRLEQLGLMPAVGSQLADQ